MNQVIVDGQRQVIRHEIGEEKFLHRQTRSHESENN